MLFIQPSYAVVPGPGTYAEIRTSFQPPKIDPDAPPIVTVPFDCHEIRQVCEPVIKTDKPVLLIINLKQGPGAYENKFDINNTTKKKTRVGRFGVFGTRSDRIRPDTFEVPKDIMKDVPGPGYYNPSDKSII